MRMMMQVKLPLEPFSAAVKDGSAGRKIKKILDETRPEAVYFGSMDGHRGGFLVVDMADASKLPSLSEPWFLQFNAEAKFFPVMTPDDLAKAGLEEHGKKWG